MGLVRSLLRQLLLKVAILAVVLVALVAVMFFVFQVYLVSCPGLTTNKCWFDQYVPQGPPKGSDDTSLYHIQTIVLGQYGAGQPVWVRVVDYYKLMLSSSFGYNIGTVVTGSVNSTISTFWPYTAVLVLSSTLTVLAAGWLLGLVGRSGKSRHISPISAAAFLVPGVVLSGASAWSVIATLSPGPSNWYDKLLGHLGPPGYVTLGAATFLKTGLAYDWAALGAMWPPFAFLAVVGFLSLLALRLFNRGRVYFLTAFAACLVSGLSWAITVETIYAWPGLGRAYYLGEAGLDLPLMQASAFELSIFAIVTVFALFVIRDIVCFAARLTMRRGWNSRILRWIASPPEPGTTLW